MNQERAQHRPESRARDDIPFWEWAVAALGLALVMASVGFLVYRAVTEESLPPDISVQVDSIAASRDGYLVRIRVLNSGGSTAAGLTVEGELADGNAIVETSHTRFDYVPARSERGGGLFFTRDPRRFRLQVRPKGYQRP